jgi:hypothetical protein
VPAFAAPSPDGPVSRQVDTPAPRAIAAEVALETAGGTAEEAPIAAKSERAELNILPAAETRRPAVSWETAAASPTPETASAERSSFRTDRPVFRPESRRGNQVENRGPGREGDRGSAPGDSPRGFAPRESAGRPAGRERSPQPLRPSPAPASAPTPAPRPTGGFMGWLKGLLGRKPAPTPAQPTATPGNFGRGDDQPGNREGGRDGQRRRRRGGRGRGQGFARGEGDQGGQGPHAQGPREDGGSFRRDRAPDGDSGAGPSEGPQGGQQGDAASGHRPRRHRGGRGRNRGGEHRSEGQKGGGAI